MNFAWAFQKNMYDYPSFHDDRLRLITKKFGHKIFSYMIIKLLDFLLKLQYIYLTTESTGKIA